MLFLYFHSIFHATKVPDICSYHQPSNCVVYLSNADYIIFSILSMEPAYPLDQPLLSFTSTYPRLIFVIAADYACLGNESKSFYNYYKYDERYAMIRVHAFIFLLASLSPQPCLVTAYTIHTQQAPATPHGTRIRGSRPSFSAHRIPKVDLQKLIAT
jgi:hypothetical protein